MHEMFSKSKLCLLNRNNNTCAQVVAVQAILFTLKKQIIPNLENTGSIISDIILGMYKDKFINRVYYNNCL